MSALEDLEIDDDHILFSSFFRCTMDVLISDIAEGCCGELILDWGPHDVSGWWFHVRAKDQLTHASIDRKVSLERTDIAHILDWSSHDGLAAYRAFGHMLIGLWLSGVMGTGEAVSLARAFSSKCNLITVADVEPSARFQTVKADDAKDAKQPEA